MTSIELITPNPEADAQRRHRLRRMRTLATGLLLFAGVVYLLTLHRDGFWGFVNAGAEASMVGAIADWFAVTALFKHPLGLPIPHTALIPRRKDDLGRSLQEFMRDNFLQEPIIRERIGQAQPTKRLGVWLSEPANAERAVREGSTLLALGLRRVRDDDIAALVTDVLVPRLKDESFSAIAGSLLDEIVRDDAHHGVVDLALEEMHRWLVNNQQTFTEVLGERAPWWAPERLNTAVTERLHLEAIRWVEDIRADPQHDARRALDSMLHHLADDLQHDPETQQRAERMKDRLLDHPQVASTAISLWQALRNALISGLEDTNGPLRARAVAELIAFGQRLGTDQALRDRLDGAAADFAVFAVTRYGDELTGVITQTIERWDGREAASRIELHVGPDLQFIRINGTLVGGLVGVLIHTISVML